MASIKIQNLKHRITAYAWILIGVWTVCITGSLLWNFHEIKNRILMIARNGAQVTFENDTFYRKWVAKHGGVYVPVSDETPSNPYLNVPNKDVITSTGIQLTLMNPAYMTRQVYQMAAGNVTVNHGHITSLKPIRPENHPDAWESDVLRLFEGRKVTEVISIENFSGKEYVRIMHPFIAEKACLKCHASQGYKEGDIRGGISVSVPTSPLWAIERPHIWRMSVAHVFLWLFGITGIVITKNSLQKQVIARESAEQNLQLSNQELQSATESLKKANEQMEEKVRQRTTDLQNTVEVLHAEVTEKQKTELALRASQSELRSVASELSLAEERERRRIALLLHDHIAQILAVLKMKLGSVKDISESPQERTKYANEMRGLIDEAIRSTRTLTYEISPPSLYTLGLESALEEMCEKFSANYGLACSFEDDGISKNIPEDLRALLYRSAGELMTNVVKHAKATTAKIILSKNDHHIELKIIDNGNGFESPGLKSSISKEMGFGLLSIRERLNHIGGNLEIMSTPDKGTTIKLTAPLQN